MPLPQEYKASITREQFLYFETRVIARLKLEGLSDDEIVNRAVDENLLEMPTEKSISMLARGCIRRLDAVDDTIVELIANASSDVAKQANLYAIMCFNRLVWDFMVNVIGEKYESFDTSFSKKDVNMFFKMLQEQNDQIRSWSDSTIDKIKSVLIKILYETDYLDDIKSETLNPVYLDDTIKETIIKSGDEVILPAFNCLR